MTDKEQAEAVRLIDAQSEKVADKHFAEICKEVGDAVDYLPSMTISALGGAIARMNFYYIDMVEETSGMEIAKHVLNCTIGVFERLRDNLGAGNAPD